MHLRYIIVCAAICLLSLVVFATTTSAQTLQPATSTPVLTSTPMPQPTATPQPDPEVIALRAQLDLMRDTDSRMLATVYWALSFVGALAVLLVGYNWFTNKWQYERDKTTLFNELRSLLNKELNDRVSEVEARYTTLFTMRFEQFDKLFDMKLESSEGSVKRELRQVKKKLIGMECEQAQKEALDYEDQYFYHDAVDCYEFILISVNYEIQDSPDNVSYCSDNISAALEGIQRILKAGFKPQEEHIDLWRTHMKRLPEKCSLEIEFIEDLIRSSKGLNQIERKQKDALLDNTLDT
jgi:hypothetical protein